MPASLIKMYITATATAPTATGGSVSTTVSSTSQQVVALASAGTVTGTTLTILATAFVDGSGDPVTQFPTNSGFYSLYVNGVLQQEGLSTLTTSQISIEDGDQIATSSPIVIQFVASTGNSTYTDPTISAPTITVET